MKYIDPNGKDILDFIGGIAHSVVSNFTLGTVEHSTDGITDADDYNAGQAVGDGVSIIMGAGQTIVGGGAAAGSATVVV